MGKHLCARALGRRYRPVFIRFEGDFPSANDHRMLPGVPARVAPQFMFAFEERDERTTTRNRPDRYRLKLALET
jgi:hypothetical protein